jgi:hypothetical protein
LSKELSLALLQSAHVAAGIEIPQLDVIADLIARESGGNPWFIELACSLVDESFVPSASDGLVLDEILWQRASQLPEAARVLLQVIAVAGRPLAQADAFEAAGLGAEGQDSLEHLRSFRSRLVRTTGLYRDELDTYHDRVRETVMRYLTPENRRDFHRRLATVLETSRRADPEALALHWQEAGESIRAGEHAARAAARAEAALAFDQGATLYQLAINLLPANVVTKLDLRTKLANALANAGRGVEAATAYRAASVGMSRGDQLERLGFAAAQLIRSGHIDQGLLELRGVLEAIGLKLATTPGRALRSALACRFLLRLKGLRFRERDVIQIPPDELSRIDICWSVSTALGMIDNIRGADFSARHLLLALHAGEPYRVVRALTVEVAYAAGTRWGRGRVRRLLGIADALAQRLEHPHAQGMVTMATGVSAFLSGDWPRALEFCNLAEGRFLEHCTGVAWELDTTRTISLWSYFFMGEVALLKRRLPTLIREAQERGNLYAATNFATLAGHLLWLAEDDPRGARTDLDTVVGKWSQEGFHIQHVTSEIARTQIDLYDGDHLTARDRLIARWPALEASLLLHGLQVIKIVMVDLRARNALAMSRGTTDPRPFLYSAERDALLLERANVPWSAALAKLIRAAIASRRGDDRAASLLSEAASACDSVSMRLIAAAARRRLGGLVGGDQGRSIITSADDWMKKQGIQNSVRMTAMLAPGFSN